MHDEDRSTEVEAVPQHYSDLTEAKGWPEALSKFADKEPEKVGMVVTAAMVVVAIITWQAVEVLPLLTVPFGTIVILAVINRVSQFIERKRNVPSSNTPKDPHAFRSRGTKPSTS